MKCWSDDLAAFLAAVWAELGDYTRARAGYPGLVTLATRGSGGPELRQVVLRKTDRANAQLVLHTDSDSHKVAELAADPAVSLLAWNPEHQLQIRVRGRAEILGPYAAETIWSSLPFASQGNYGVTPAPGTPIAAASDYQRVPDKGRLAVVVIGVGEIDAVHLAEPHHIRARFRAEEGWAGEWLAP